MNSSRPPISGVHAGELDLDADLAAQVDVLPDVALAGVAHEARDRHVLAELGDRGRQALAAPGRSDPSSHAVVRRVAGLLDLGRARRAISC